MKKVPLSRGLFAIVDDEDFDRVMGRTWSAEKSKVGWYAYTNLTGGKGKKHTSTRMHRFILNSKPREQVDHRDGNGLNNVRSNLRPASNTQNSRNSRKKPGKNKFKGVYKDKRPLSKPWMAHIKVNYKRIFLGRWKTERQAAKAYNAAALEHFGEFAKLNVI